ncbi:PilZ domain-containing protein [Sphingobium sp. AS12]|uniref:PilZ domain-containing protein n=1 Tax=Sphingobium sp. AS12 TaxID=2849495 RepID=UPI001C319316|nr:PilZ domain-containing protein [Sphingobium sp. AS12]
MPNFADPSAADISAQILSPRAQRASVMLGAMIEYGNGKEPTKHRVRDISAGGIRIDGAHEMQAGTEVTVSIGLLQAIAGSVKWTRQGLAGIAFNEMIDPSEARKRPGDTSYVVTSQIRERIKLAFRPLVGQEKCAIHTGSRAISCPPAAPGSAPRQQRRKSRRR